MNYRIEHDDPAKRETLGQYTYRIYQDDRLVARYWHDCRGDEHGIEFMNGISADSLGERVTDFIEGGGPEPLRLSKQAVAYLNARCQAGA